MRSQLLVKPELRHGGGEEWLGLGEWPDMEGVARVVGAWSQRVGPWAGPTVLCLCPSLPSLPQAGSKGEANPSSPKPQDSWESGHRMLRVLSWGGGAQQEPRRQNTP